MTKQTLIQKLGTMLLGATGLVGLAGCEAPQGTRNTSPYAQSQPYQQTKEDDGNLEMAILGGVLGVNSNPWVRGIGNGMLADATRPKTNVNVNVNGSQNTSQPQVVYVPVEKVDERLLPEYNMEQLKREGNFPVTENSSLEEGIYSVFTSKNTLDLNGNGNYDFGEFIDVKRNFMKGETIKLNAKFIARNGNFIKEKTPCPYKVSFEITNELGEVVLREDYSGTEKKIHDRKVLFLGLPELKHGIYNAKVSYSSKRVTNQRGAVFQVLE